MLLLPAVISSINARDLVQLTAMHAHAKRQLPPSLMMIWDLLSLSIILVQVHLVFTYPNYYQYIQSLTWPNILECTACCKCFAFTSIFFSSTMISSLLESVPGLAKHCKGFFLPEKEFCNHPLQACGLPGLLVLMSSPVDSVHSRLFLFFFFYSSWIKDHCLLFNQIFTVGFKIWYAVAPMKIYRPETYGLTIHSPSVAELWLPLFHNSSVISSHASSMFVIVVSMRY